MPTPHVQHVEAISPQRSGERARIEIPKMMTRVVVCADVSRSYPTLFEKELYPRGNGMNVRKDDEQDAVASQQLPDAAQIRRRIFQMFENMMHDDRVKVIVAPVKRHKVSTLNVSGEFGRESSCEVAVNLISLHMPSALLCNGEQMSFTRTDIEQRPFRWDETLQQRKIKIVTIVQRLVPLGLFLRVVRIVFGEVLIRVLRIHKLDSATLTSKD